MKILINSDARDFPNFKGEHKHQGGPGLFRRKFIQFFSSSDKYKIIEFALFRRDLSLKSYSKQGNLYTYNSKNINYSIFKSDTDNLYKVARGTSVKVMTRHSEVIISEMVDVLNRLSPDMVYLNGFDVFSYYLSVAAKKIGIPYVFQHAGILNVEVEMYKHLYSKKGLDFLKKMEIEATNSASFNIFLTHFSKKYFIDNISKINAPNGVIRLPVDFKRRKKRIIKKTSLSVGIVARWDRIKNYQKILELSEFSRMSGEKIDFYAVTKIPDTKKNFRFKNLFKDNVKIVNPMDNSSLHKFYTRMDVTLLPSHFDTSPFVVIESILCGTPCIVSDRVGLKEIFTGYSKKLYIDDFTDKQKIIDKIKKVSTKRISEDIYKYIKVNFNENKIMKKHEDLFRKILINK